MKNIKLILSAFICVCSVFHQFQPLVFPHDSLAPRSDIDPIEFRVGLVITSIERACGKFAKPSLSAEEHRQVCDTVRREFPEVHWFENHEGFEFAVGYRYYFLKYRGGKLSVVSDPADYVVGRWDASDRRMDMLRVIALTKENAALIAAGFKKWKAGQASLAPVAAFVSAVKTGDGAAELLDRMELDKYSVYVVLAPDGSAQGVFQMKFSGEARRPPYLAAIETGRAQTEPDAGRFSGVGMEMTYAACRVALQTTQMRESDDESAVVMSSAHIAPRGKSYAVAVSRFYPDRFRFKYDGSAEWLYHPKRGVIRFMCYQLVRDGPAGLPVEDVWEMTGLKQLGFSKRYVEEVLDELTRESRSDCRIVRRRAGGTELYYYPAHLAGAAGDGAPAADTTETVIIDSGRYPLDPDRIFQIAPGIDAGLFRSAVERVNESILSRKVITLEDLKTWNKMMCSRYEVIRPMLLRGFSYGVYRSFVQEWRMYWFLWDMNGALGRGIRGDPVAFAVRMYKRFVDIQPFWDGNRRTALLVMCYILAKEGLIFQWGDEDTHMELVDLLWNKDADGEDVYRFLKQHVRPVWEISLTRLRNPGVDETTAADSAVGISP